MNMKFFRFLYEETMSCFIHFGEVKDSGNGEHCTFLYLKGSRKSGKQASAGHVLFLCPKTVDFVILGSVDDDVMAAAQNILRDLEVGTVVLPPTAPAEVWKSIGAKNIVQLSCGEGSTVSETRAERKDVLSGKDELSRKDELSEKDELTGKDALTGQDAVECKDHLKLSAAGWGLWVQCCGENAVAMLHGLDQKPEAGKPLADVFEDCVMNVKVLDEGKRCCYETEPDGYACALGCVYQQDHDACKFKRSDGSFPYPVGTLLLPETGGELAVGRWRNEAKEELDAVRFVVISQYDGKELPLPEDGRRYYLIGSAEEMSDASVAAACRDGLNHEPVLLKDGEGICCSGMLKYC